MKLFGVPSALAIGVVIGLGLALIVVGIPLGIAYALEVPQWMTYALGVAAGISLVRLRMAIDRQIEADDQANNPHFHR